MAICKYYSYPYNSLQVLADVTDENGYTLLHMAAFYSHMDIFECWAATKNLQ